VLDAAGQEVEVDIRSWILKGLGVRRSVPPGRQKLT